MIDAFADLWFWFVLQVWSLRPVERDGASSLWKRIIHSLITCLIRNVGINAPQITWKLPIHIQNRRMQTKQQHSSKFPLATLGKGNFMVWIWMFFDCISIYGFRSKISVYLYVICGLWPIKPLRHSSLLPKDVTCVRTPENRPDFCLIFQNKSSQHLPQSSQTSTQETNIIPVGNHKTVV